MLKRLKVMRNLTSIYTHWTFNLKNFFKKLQIHMWPICIHVNPYVTHVHPCVNYERTITQLKVNWKLTKILLEMN
jgi:hypothetical protein